MARWDFSRRSQQRHQQAHRHPQPQADLEIPGPQGRQGDGPDRVEQLLRVVHSPHTLRQRVRRLENHLFLSVVRIDAPNLAGEALGIYPLHGASGQGGRKVQRHGDNAPEIPLALFVRQKDRQPPVHVQPDDILVSLQGKDTVHDPVRREEDVSHIVLPQQDMGDPAEVRIVPAGLDEIGLQNAGFAHLGEHKLIRLRPDGAGDIAHAVPLLVPAAPLHAANKHQSGRQGQYKSPSGVNQRRPLCGPHQGDPSLFLAPAFFIKEYVKSARNASRGPGPIRRCQSSVLPRKIHWIHRQPAGR